MRLALSVPAGPLLDVGCGTMPYRHLFPQSVPYEGLEISQERQLHNPLVTFFYDGTTFPLQDNQYSAILCSEVLEHSFVPEILLSECHRVLRPGGALLLTVPFLWPEHEQPWDSQRFTSFGLRQRLLQAGFTVEEYSKLNQGLPAIIQLLIDWNESLGRRLSDRIASTLPRKLFRASWTLFWVIPYSIANVFGFSLRVTVSLFGSGAFPLSMVHQLHGAELYISNVVLARKASSSSFPASL
jgi:SAM-dependent methyltransferase